MPGFAPASVARKPLLPAEIGAAKKLILVTGATGYIGSRVVERLLAGGHDVQVLARPRAVAADPDDMVAFLKRLPGAAKQLTVVLGDVTDPKSLASAMAGVDQLVHLAAVVDVLQPRSEAERQRMMATALEGTQVVLDAATAARTITKVLLASSIVAVCWDWWERGRDHVYDERDWTLDRSVALNTYAYCKRESERLAYRLAEGKRWDLVTINPGIVFGPVATRRLARSTSVWAPIVEHMNGAKFPFTSNLTISHVDLDDVAAAVCGLLATPGARGRHLMMSGAPPSMPQIARLLARAYPRAKVPPLTAPGWTVALLARVASARLGFDLPKFRAMHAKPYRVDARKLARALPGFEYIPLEASVRAAADSVVAMGLAAASPLAMAAGCCRAPLVADGGVDGIVGGGGSGSVHSEAAAAGGAAAAVALARQGSVMSLGKASVPSVKSAVSFKSADAAGDLLGGPMMVMVPGSPVGAAGDDAIASAVVASEFGRRGSGGSGSGPSSSSSSSDDGEVLDSSDGGLGGDADGCAGAGAGAATAAAMPRGIGAA